MGGLLTVQLSTHLDMYYPILFSSAALPLIYSLLYPLTLLC